MPTTHVKQLRLENVSLKATVGSQYILREISFDVFQGDRLAIVGPSGAGKTSLLRLLNRLTEATEGTIYFEEQRVQQIPVITLRQQITLVSQESKLLGMTVRDALTYPLRLREMSKSDIQQRLNTWTELVHLPSEWLDRTEVQLSVGQRQLVAIARALITQPKILLLDEPTSALDAGRGSYLLQTLKTLTESGQMTIVMVNHQLDLAQQFCGRVLYLQQGKLLQDTAADQTDWVELRDRLVQAEAQESEEWE